MKNKFCMFRKDLLNFKLNIVNNINFKKKIKLDIMEFPYQINLFGLNINFNRYPLNKEIKKIKKKIKIINNINNKKIDIILGNGSEEIISLLILSCNKYIGCLTPTFSIYEKYSFIHNKRLFKFKNMHIKNNIDIFFICNPNNPTGTTIKQKKLEKNIKTNKNCLFVIDETYFNFSKQKSYLEFLKYNNVVLLRSLSKIGLAGLRFGYLIGHKKIIKILENIKSPFNINKFTLFIINKIIFSIFNKNIKFIIKEREKIYNFLKNKSILFFKSNCNFILIKNSNINSLYLFLKTKNIFIKKLYNKYLRISIGKKKENIKILNFINIYENNKKNQRNQNFY
ncbi:aminotransferase class I/II-fold pyridoxal phosphate-dependent enzyme [Candidatus Vidania fulgoroideorum]